MKQCSKCKIEKDFSDFHKLSESKSGYKSACKICRSIETKEYYEKNKEKNKRRRKKYYEENREKELTRGRKYSELNKDKKNKYRRERFKYDELFRLSMNIRSLIYQKIKNNGYTKKSKTNEILGCSFNEFKNYLESKFESWMSWDNYGKYNGELNFGWDIDHIIPISSAKTEEELLKLNHYTNLQPLCSKVNRDIKINKLEYGNI